MFRVISASNPRIVYNKQCAKMKPADKFDLGKSDFSRYDRAVQTCQRLLSQSVRTKVVRKEDHESMIA